MTSSASNSTRWLLRIAAVLWVIWGVVHLLAGIATIAQVSSGSVAEAVQAITNAVPLEELQDEYNSSIQAILIQHGFNLAWFGLVTLIGAFFVWRQNITGIWVTAMVGGLADLGYFTAIDLQGLAAFPGPQMTYICATAILLSAIAYFRDLRHA
ncbi:MAG: hypothetical protein AAGD01_01375 [Acidobacteriota bacterium]